MRYSYLILVVNFRKDLRESETINSLRKIAGLKKNTKIIIWDNIPFEGNFLYQQILGEELGDLEYIPSEKNEKLSCIYNYVINRKLNKFEYLIIFDNDSNITYDYFSLLDESIASNKEINLFLPIVESSGVIVSPAKMFYFKGFYYKNVYSGKANALYKTAVNSGMVISSKYLSDGFRGYDERLSLYGVDDYFMRMYSKQNEFFYILDYKIKHSLSIHVQESIDMKIFRFLNLKKGIRIVNKDVNIFLKFVIELYLFFCSARESIRYKSLKFLSNQT